MNWNERFSITAACESCPINISYSWKLYLVNASSKSIPDGKDIGNILLVCVSAWHLLSFLNFVFYPVPFCGNLDISLPSKLEDTPSVQHLVTAGSPSILNQKERSDEIKIQHDRVVSWSKHGRSVKHTSLLDLLSETDGASGLRLYSSVV